MTFDTDTNGCDRDGDVCMDVQVSTECVTLRAELSSVSEECLAAKQRVTELELTVQRQTDELEVGSQLTVDSGIGGNLSYRICG